jgi:hypothetical protein
VIKMAPFQTGITPKDVVNKIVFKTTSIRWPDFGEMRFATNMSQSRVYLSKLLTTGINAEDAMHPDNLLGVADGYVSIASIACICDTMEEANAVLTQLKGLRALDGQELGDKSKQILSPFASSVPSAQIKQHEKRLQVGT